MVFASVHDYGSSVLQFSPSGDLLQLDYATKAAARGGLIAGVKASDGVILLLASKKPTSRLILSSMKRVAFPSSPDVAMVVSGLRMDSGYLFRQARQLADEHRAMFSTEVSSEALSAKINELYYEHTCTAGVRPIGVNALIVGPDSNGEPRIFSCSPQGRGEAWKGIAFGKHSGLVNSVLKKELSGQQVQSTNVLRRALLPKIFKKLSGHLKCDISNWDIEIWEGVSKNQSSLEWNRCSFPQE